MYLLEYYVGDKKEQKGLFHYEHFVGEDTLRLTHPMFTYGWKPVCLVPEKLSCDVRLSKLLDSLERKPYEHVVNAITLFVANIIEKEYNL